MVARLGFERVGVLCVVVGWLSGWETGRGGMEKGWIVLRGQGCILGNGRRITHSRHGGKAIVQDAVFVDFLQGVSVWEIAATAPIYEDNTV